MPDLYERTERNVLFGGQKKCREKMIDHLFTAYILYSGCHLPDTLFPHEIEADGLHQDGEDPGYRIGNKEKMQGSVLGEEQIDPYDSGPYRTDNRQYHGYGGMAHSPEGARDQIHDAAQEIGYGGDGKNLQSALDDFCVCSVDAQYLCSEDICAHTHDQRYAGGQDHTVQKHPVHTLCFFHAVILAGKAHACLGHGIDCHIQEAQHIVGGGVAGHGYGAEGIDRGLEQGVGKADHRALDTCRNSNLEDAQQIETVDPQLAEGKLVAAFRAVEAAKHQKAGNTLGSHGADGYACHSPGDHNDKQKIQYDISHAGAEEEQQRPLGVSHRPEDGGSIIIKHEKGHSHKVDGHISDRLIDDISGGPHKNQDRSCSEYADKCHENTADQRQCDGSMYGFRHFFCAAGWQSSRLPVHWPPEKCR